MPAVPARSRPIGSCSTAAEIAALSSESLEAFNGLLPPHWSHGNPVDILGDADAARYAKAVEIVARDPQNDGVLVILTPQAMTDAKRPPSSSQRFAERGEQAAPRELDGRPRGRRGDSALNDAGIPTFAYPDTAARAFAAMWRYSDNLARSTKRPRCSRIRTTRRSHARAAKIIAAAREGRAHAAHRVESKKLLAAYGIPTVETRVATSEDEAVEIAAQLGGPVVLKLHSETITHKTDVGGVKLESARRRLPCAARGVRSRRRSRGGPDFLGVTVQPMIARDGYELILGSSSIRSSARCCSSARAVSSSKSSRIARSACRRSMPRSRAG